MIVMASSGANFNPRAISPPAAPVVPGARRRVSPDTQAVPPIVLPEITYLNMGRRPELINPPGAYLMLSKSVQSSRTPLPCCTAWQGSVSDVSVDVKVNRFG